MFLIKKSSQAFFVLFPNSAGSRSITESQSGSGGTKRSSAGHKRTGKNLILIHCSLSWFFLIWNIVSVVFFWAEFRAPNSNQKEKNVIHNVVFSPLSKGQKVKKIIAYKVPSMELNYSAIA